MRKIIPIVLLSFIMACNVHAYRRGSSYNEGELAMDKNWINFDERAAGSDPNKLPNLGAGVPVQGHQASLIARIDKIGQPLRAGHRVASRGLVGPQQLPRFSVQRVDVLVSQVKQIADCMQVVDTGHDPGPEHLSACYVHTEHAAGTESEPEGRVNLAVGRGQQRPVRAVFNVVTCHSP